VRLTKIPRYSAAELERRAEDLLRSRCGWPPAIPVDMESLVDQEAGVLLDILPGLKEIHGVAGLARYESGAVSAQARTLYAQLVKVAGFGDPAAILAHLEERLARLHAVSAAAMRHRLREWPLRITQKVERAMKEGLTILE
jgi:hypothetical protein